MVTTAILPVASFTKLTVPTNISDIVPLNHAGPHPVSRDIVPPKQLPHNRLKHGVPHKVHQLHLPRVAIATQTGVKLQAERVTQCGSGGGQPALEGVMDGRVVSEEGGGGHARHLLTDGQHCGLEVHRVRGEEVSEGGRVHGKGHPLARCVDGEDITMLDEEEYI